jgi:y4mF family transcriptional regulator
MMHILEEIGNKIKKRRKFLKLTQKDLAEISGVSLRSLIQAENGKGNLTLKQISKILDTLGLTIEVKVK